MDLEIACKIACILVVALGFFLLTAQIRGTKQEVRITKTAVLDSIGLVRSEVAASTSLRLRHRVFGEATRDKTQLLRVNRSIPDPALRRVVDVTRDSTVPSASPPPPVEAAIVDVEFSPDERFDTTGGRWLKHVLEGTKQPLSKSPREPERCAVWGVTPRAADRSLREDTPAPPGQRSPILQAEDPPSSGSRRSLR
jgi:hypothetical protein